MDLHPVLVEGTYDSHLLRGSIPRLARRDASGFVAGRFRASPAAGLQMMGL